MLGSTSVPLVKWPSFSPVSMATASNGTFLLSYHNVIEMKLDGWIIRAVMETNRVVEGNGVRTLNVETDPTGFVNDEWASIGPSLRRDTCPRPVTDAQAHASKNAENAEIQFSCPSDDRRRRLVRPSL
eukprot:Polyplicarium_translucidae@DN1797_c0_g1_i3.p1